MDDIHKVRKLGYEDIKNAKRNKKVKTEVDSNTNNNEKKKDISIGLHISYLLILLLSIFDKLYIYYLIPIAFFMIFVKKEESWKFSHFERQGYFVFINALLGLLIELLFYLNYFELVSNLFAASSIIAIVLISIIYFLMLLIKGFTKLNRKEEFKSIWK